MKDLLEDSLVLNDPTTKLLLRTARLSKLVACCGFVIAVAILYLLYDMTLVPNLPGEFFIILCEALMFFFCNFLFFLFAVRLKQDMQQRERKLVSALRYLRYAMLLFLMLLVFAFLYHLVWKTSQQFL